MFSNANKMNVVSNRSNKRKCPENIARFSCELKIDKCRSRNESRVTWTNINLLLLLMVVPLSCLIQNLSHSMSEDWGLKCLTMKISTKKPSPFFSKNFSNRISAHLYNHTIQICNLDCLRSNKNEEIVSVAQSLSLEMPIPFKYRVQGEVLITKAKMRWTETQIQIQYSTSIVIGFVFDEKQKLRRLQIQ